MRSYTQPAKIIVIAGSFPVRSETFIKQHVLGLADRGYCVSAISCGSSKDIQYCEIEEIDRAGVKRINVPCFGQSQFQNLYRVLTVSIRHTKMLKYLSTSPPWTRREMFWAREIWQVIDEIEPDVLHIHSGSRAGALVRYRLPQCPTVVTWHGPDANHMPEVRGKLMYQELFGLPLIHTVGSAFMQQRVESLGAASKQITKVPMGIDTNYFTYKERVIATAQPLRIVSVGRLVEVKGHAFLIQAVSELLDEGQNLELKIVGYGPLKQLLNVQVHDSKHSSKIQLVGAKTSHEVLCELQAADLFCLTGVRSFSGEIEAQGVVFAEAQATGLPVIASSIGGMPDSLIDGETGLLCPPGDVSAIKRAIRFFLEDREAVVRFGRQGRKFVESKFSANSMIDSFENLYASTTVDHLSSSYR
ncbi:glycosyltransferase [Leptolyngbya sp. BC1307]|uniref:glycosyltransferase n=1 Tax=Leptolyngbya sp. BC1307 TaxID=2029589 RepID=UPI000EFCBB2F|nr:glycosyltransferase [Leptolyngbya sp. BC1307]